MNKRAAELTMNAIVLAALALLVLIVLAFVFKEQIGGASKQYTAASAKTGSCLENPQGKDCDMFKDTSKISSTHRTSIFFSFHILGLK